MKWIGIDFGSNLAGTTAVCLQQNDGLYVYQSNKKKSADVFINEVIKTYSPGMIFIDAPLSLPSAYFGNGKDFFYRDCDRKVNAMSPMFLGGLTARAMRLRYENQPLKFFECYPKQLATVVLDLDDLYLKKDLSKVKSFMKKLSTEVPIPIISKVENWHQVDAILCWLSGWRFSRGVHQVYGYSLEGEIIN